MIWYYDTIFVVGALSFTFSSIGKKGFFTPHPHQHLSVTFLMIANVTGLRWYLTLALISTALIISNAKHLFTCLKAICISSLKNFLFRSSAVSKIGLVDFLIYSRMCSWAINTLSDISLANTFAHSVFGFFQFVSSFLYHAKAF